MGILDDIANPKVPSALEGIKVVQDIQNSQTQRYLANVQAGRVLQQIMDDRRKQEQQQQGTSVIKNYLQPQTQPNNGIAQPSTTSKPYNFDQQSAKTLAEPFQNVPTDEIQRAQTLSDLADKLATMPGNQQMAQFYYNMAENAYQHVQKETATQRTNRQLMLEQVGNNFYDISKLEEAGKTNQAKSLYNQTKDEILSDPRFANNQEVQNFFKQFSTYQPGLGKYIYATTMYGQKARQQFIQEQQKTSASGTTYRLPTSDGYMGIYDKTTNKLIDYVRDENGNKLHSWNWTKEQAIQGRSTERVKLAQEKVALTKEKQDITNTDQIIRFKNQETKDLRGIQEGLTRALTLAQNAEPKDYPMIDKMLKQSMSKWENTSVRAYAELQQYSNYGNLEQRVAGNISQFFKGTMTDEQRKMAIDTANTLLNEYVNPALAGQNAYWRRIAAERHLDPDQVNPYENIQQIGEDVKAGNITQQEANKILSKPRFKKQLEEWQRKHQTMQ